MDVNKLCMGCMRELDGGDGAICPHCGYKVGSLNSSRGLQPQTILNGKYIVGKVIGEGGFGITYIAYDLVLNNRVAIKEYFPSELVTRDTSTGTQTSLTVLTGSEEEQYQKGMDRFVKEAANLAKFNNLPGIVSVKEFFYENNTAYMVMEYIDGITLSKYMDDNGGKLSYTRALELMMPIMNSLEKVHEAGIVHRDISPDNIMISTNGSMKLIDFGAARTVGNDDAKSLTVILKHGYAPEEQYQPDGKQGPWTDIYALSATMYRMITGVVPQESTDRILSGDKVEAVRKINPEVPKLISNAIMHGLMVKSINRTKNISDFIAELDSNSKNGRKKRKLYIGLSVGIIGLCVVGTVGLFYKKINNKDIIDSDEQKIIKETIVDEKLLDVYSSDQSTEIVATPQSEEKTEEELIALIEKNSGYSVVPEEDSSYRLNDYMQFQLDYKYRLYEDFDGDGYKELFAYVCLEELENSYNDSYPYAISNTRLWYSDGNNTYQITPSAYEYVLNQEDLFSGSEQMIVPVGLNLLRFGRMQDVCEVYADERYQETQLLCQTYHIENDMITPIIKFQPMALGRDNEDKPLVYNFDTSPLSMDFHSFDEAFRSDYKGKNWKQWLYYLYTNYYIYELDEKYYIYDVTELTDSDLSGYENFSEITQNIENAMRCSTYAEVDFSLWWNSPYDVRREKAYLSDNDMVYINYSLFTQPDVTEEEDEMWNYPSKDPSNKQEFELTAVFSINENTLYLECLMPGWMDNGISIYNGEISMNDMPQDAMKGDDNEQKSIGLKGEGDTITVYVIVDNNYEFSYGEGRAIILQLDHPVDLCYLDMEGNENIWENFSENIFVISDNSINGGWDQYNGKHISCKVNRFLEAATGGIIVEIDEVIGELE